jgi:phosphate transport system permease protein
MSEYVKDGWPKKIIKQMTNNLAGVPSIVFGLFGMSLFVNKLEFGDSILAGGLTLGLLVLPVIIRTTEESLKPLTIHLGKLVLGWEPVSGKRRVKLYFQSHFQNHYRINIIDRKSFWRDGSYFIYRCCLFFT